MKKIFLALAVIVFASTLAIAEEASAPKQAPASQQPSVTHQQPAMTPAAAPAASAHPQKVASKSAETRYLRGKVELISLADPAKGTKSEIVVLGKGGKKINFLVMSTTTIYDINSKPISLDQIKKDENVKVTYATTKEGLDEARSIRLVK